MAAEQIQHPLTNDRGILDFLEKKEEENKPDDELSVPEFAETHVLKSEEKKEDEENKPSLTEKLHRSNSSSSSSDEEGEGGKKKSKGLKDKIKEKIGGEKEQEKNVEHDQVVAGDVTRPEGAEDKKGFAEKIKEKLPGTHKTDNNEELGEKEDKKGFMEKIKDKLPVGTNKTDEVAPVEYHPTEANKHQDESEEKKGFMEKIKEKLPGIPANQKNVEVKGEKENGNYY